MYDYKPYNNTATITAARGTAGIGPDVPGNPRTQTGATTVMWDEVDSLYGLPVECYHVQGLDTAWTTLAHCVTGQQYVDHEPGGGRDYRVRAVNLADERGPWSRSVFAALSEDAGPPEPPGNLRAKLNLGGSITLTWEAVGFLLYGDPVSHYEVQRQRGAWETIANGVTETEYTDFNADGRMLPYRVRAVNAKGREGPWSDVIDVVTAEQRGQLAAPTLSAHTTTEDTVRLTWTVPSNQRDAVTGYELQYLDGDEWLTLDELGPEDTEYEDRSLPFGAVRTYRVRARAGEEVGQVEQRGHRHDAIRANRTISRPRPTGPTPYPSRGSRRGTTPTTRCSATSWRCRPPTGTAASRGWPVRRPRPGPTPTPG